MASTESEASRDNLRWRWAALGVIGSAALALGGVASAAETYAQQGQDQRLVVVELFTSQGCSSCPPADELQAELAERPDILALTFPVDYWDYLGWHDTLARPENSSRQIDYSKRSHSGRVFTPQMIIDGVYSAIGGQRADVLQKIDTRELVALPVPLNIAVDNDKVSVHVPSAPGALNDANTGKATLWLFPFNRMNTVHIGAGENQGRMVRYAHVVGDFVGMGQWSGTAATYEHTLDKADAGEFGYAAILQEDRVGPVLGAAWAGDTSRMHQPSVVPEPGEYADPLVVNIAR